MPRETLSITKFLTGLITNVDSKDVPIDAGTDGTQNLNPNVNGKLAGMPLYSVAVTEVAASVENGRQFGFIEKSDGDYDLVIANNADTQVVTDFYGTPSVSTDGASDSSKCIIISREEAHVGCGTANKARWSGYIRHDQLGNSTYKDTLQHENAECLNKYHAGATPSNGEVYFSAISSQGAWSGSEAPFALGIYYRYVVSCVFDGFQESPMIEITDFDNDYTGGNNSTSTDIYLAVKGGQASPPTSLNKRITGFNIYRAEFDGRGGTTDKFDERTSFTLVKQVDINDASWAQGTGTTPDNCPATDKFIKITDKGEYGVTFERNAGFLENIYTTDVKFTVSCELNNFHFVGNCLHDNLTSDDGTHMVFRSRPFWYDTFDWTADFLRLPFVPKALAGYNGRVYAFDNNRIARINPEGFYVEYIYEGAGCESQQGLVVTEFGMFFANSQNCYSLIDSELSIISNPIKSDWQGDSNGIDIALTYDGRTNQVIFAVLSGKAYCYHLPLKRWDYLNSLTPNDDPTGFFSGKDGESYVVVKVVADDPIYAMFGSSSERAWVHITPEYDFNDPSQEKMFDVINTDESVATVTTTFGVNGAASTTAVASLAHDRAKTIQVKLSGSGGATGAVADSMSIVFRRMLGKR